MAGTRADLAALLAAVPFATLANALGQGLGDDPFGWKNVLDQVTTVLGASYSDQATPLARALTRYYAYEQLAALSSSIDYDKGADGLTAKYSQRTSHLFRMVDHSKQDVVAAQSSVSGPSIGLLAQVSPIQVPPGALPDPNDRQYRGDPLRRRLGSQVPWR